MERDERDLDRGDRARDCDSGLDVLDKHLLARADAGEARTLRWSRFGWIDARARFRPAGFAWADAPLLCGGHWQDAKSVPLIHLTTLISDPLRETATATESAAWGFGGRLTHGVTLTGVSDKRLRLGPEGAFAVAADPGARADELSARFDYSRRPPESLSFQPTPGVRPPSHFRRLAKPVPGTGVIEARAPDPGGGIAWGVLGYRTDKGGFCVTQPGRIVGNRVGTVDFQLDTFEDVWDYGRECGLSADRLPARWPIGIGSIFGGGLTPEADDPTSDSGTGRTTLRTLPGRTVVYGIARSGVREVTIASPRDVRTLIPSPRAHSFVVVYDGTFPTGDFTATATMAEGSKRTIRQLAGF